LAGPTPTPGMLTSVTANGQTTGDGPRLTITQTPATMLVSCPFCQAILGVHVGGEYVVGSAVIEKPVTVRCQKCGRYCRWFPDGVVEKRHRGQ
jgi:hypothetical protein